MSEQWSLRHRYFRSREPSQDIFNIPSLLKIRTTGQCCRWRRLESNRHSEHAWTERKHTSYWGSLSFKTVTRANSSKPTMAFSSMKLLLFRKIIVSTMSRLTGKQTDREQSWQTCREKTYCVHCRKKLVDWTSSRHSHYRIDSFELTS